MKLATYQSESGPRAAGVREDGYVDLNAMDADLPRSMKGLLGLGAEGIARAAAATQRGEIIPADSVRLLAPVPQPQKVICIGLNYADHAKESGSPIPDEPVVFNKFPTAIRAQGDPIELPEVSDQVDYEAELVVIIGTGGRDIAEEDALSHVAGYTCGHDVSARDWQKGKPGGQWLLGKTFDSFAPMGPHLVTADEVGDPGNLNIRFRLNGETLQDSNTKQLIFSVPKLISYLSTVCTLTTGDVLFTGTPPGVGAARDPQIFLKPGDIAEVEIEKLGLLSNPVISRAI
jgi:2-keto-4-pentenoate hydratase/2-oxohepta-3-ene-1,7-dioic acid hydratase in catechol pathway